MRGELDGALDKMARMEELRRRRAAEPAGGGHDAGHAVAEAVRRVVAQHPGIAVTLRVEQETGNRLMRVAWADGTVTVVFHEPSPSADGVTSTTASSRQPEPRQTTDEQPPHMWPLSVRTVPGWEAADQDHDGAAAARLAEMVRSDPSLLGRPDRRY